MKAFSRILIFFGILWCLMSGYSLYLRYHPNSLRFETYQPTQEVQEKQQVFEQDSEPVRIVIDDLLINLPIIPATITNNVWETTHNGVSYLSSSPLPGTTGNSIIYGHNWNSLFGNLTKAVTGQTVEILYADGTNKRFIIEYTSVVSPSDAAILAKSQDRRITLYTCTGFLDSKRFVAVAILEERNHSFGRLLDTQ